MHQKLKMPPLLSRKVTAGLWCKDHERKAHAVYTAHKCITVLAKDVCRNYILLHSFSHPFTLCKHSEIDLINKIRQAAEQSGRVLGKTPAEVTAIFVLYLSSKHALWHIRQALNSPFEWVHGTAVMSSCQEMNKPLG